MSVKKADYRHSKLFLNHRSTSVSKKRHAEDYLASDRTKLAKSLVSTSVPSVQGAYPSTQNQWPAGYGVQPQTWPQAPQTQAQQWNYALPVFHCFHFFLYAEHKLKTETSCIFSEISISILFFLHFHDARVVYFLYIRNAYSHIGLCSTVIGLFCPLQ